MVDAVLRARCCDGEWQLTHQNRPCSFRVSQLITATGERVQVLIWALVRIQPSGSYSSWYARNLQHVHSCTHPRHDLINRMLLKCLLLPFPLISQAAGRLRQFMHGRQSVRFVATADVASKIAHANQLPAPTAAPSSGSMAGLLRTVFRARSHAPSTSPDITAVHVMNWVMGNTVAATQHGVLEWAAQVRALVLPCDQDSVRTLDLRCFKRCLLC